MSGVRQPRRPNQNPISTAKEGGIEIGTAGPATISETREVQGIVELATTARSEVRAQFPGRVVQVTKAVGDYVSKGQLLARIELSESLQVYPVAMRRLRDALYRRTHCQAPGTSLTTFRSMSSRTLARRRSCSISSPVTLPRSGPGRKLSLKHWTASRSPKPR